VGNLAEEAVRMKFNGKSVEDIFRHGNQNPVKYIWKEY